MRRRAATLVLCVLWAAVTACERPARNAVSRVPGPGKSQAGAVPTAAQRSPDRLSAPAHAATRTAPSCPDGFADCGVAPTGGCATDLDRDDAHCAECGAACVGGARCVGGTCRGDVIGVSAGGSHTCAWNASGHTFCWGLNGGGQLGVRGGKAHLGPTEVDTVRDATHVSAGRYSTCAVRRSGAVACWGAGALGRPTGSATHARPAAVADVERAIDVATGRGHACALRRTGGVACWGANAAGQLGAASFGSGGTPHVAPGVADAVAIAAGGAHTCVITSERRMRCWGLNHFGQLGNGTTGERHAAATSRARADGAGASEPSAALAPVEVTDLSNVADVSLGGFHSCAVTRTGELYCWGHNDAGQLGVGDRADRALPTRVALDAVADVSAGERHTCARLRAGDVYCWGAGEGGRLGDGTTEDRERPAKITGIAHAVDVSAGDMHTCALDTDGLIWCWGVNDGQLGDGTTEERNTPVQVKPALATSDRVRR